MFRFACRFSSALLLLLALLPSILAVDAQAQNRLAVEVGPLFPIGDFANSHDTSLYVGARFEFQDVNALGGVAALSFAIRGGFGVLQLDSSLKSALESAGESTSSSLVRAGAGVRAYSVASPLFFTLGVDYLNFNLPGDGDSENGVDAALGAGLTRGFPSMVVEIVFKGHAAFLANVDDIQYLTLEGSIGIPF